MSFSRISHAATRVAGLAAMVGFLSLVGCHESPTPSQGWGLVDLPDTPPARKDVLTAARSAIAEAYPHSATSCSPDSGFVIAVTPVEMTGGSKTRKQISVMVLRNFTGAYEPVVRVRQFVEVGSPGVRANPESGNAVYAVPLANNEWHTLDYLPYEEQALYDTIMKKLEEAGERPVARGEADRRRES